MTTHYGAYDLRTGVFVVGTDATEVARETGSRPAPISQQSYDRLDDFLPGYRDIVDLDAEPIIRQKEEEHGEL